MARLILIVLLLALSLPAAAQDYRQTSAQLFCRVLGGYVADSVIDFYNHVPLEQSLRRVDGYVCTDSNRKVCDAKANMVREMMRNQYELARAQGYETLQPDRLNVLADASGVYATSLCWREAKAQYGW